MRPVTAFALLGLLLTGCFDFEEAEKVIDLRVLGLAIDTPEVFVDVAPTPDEAPPLPEACGETPPYLIVNDPAPVDVRVLVVDPRMAAKPLTYSVQACVWSQSGRCDEDEHDGQRVQVVRNATGTTDELTFRFAPTARETNCWLAADSFNGFGGLFVILDVTITDGDVTLRANKIVTYNSPLLIRAGEGQEPPPEKVPNANPVMQGLRFDEQDSTTEGEAITLERGRKYDLAPIFDREAQTETYPVPTFDGGYRVLEEKLQFELYVTEGDLGDNTLETRNPIGEVEEIESSYTPPDEPTGDIALWVVLRDDRGGASWTRRTLRVR